MMEWISVKDKLPIGLGDIVKAKTQNGDELKAYFHKDKMITLASYCKNHELSHWQSREGKWLYDVTYWMPLREHPKDE